MLRLVVASVVFGVDSVTMDMYEQNVVTVNRYDSLLIYGSGDSPHWLVVRVKYKSMYLAK